MSGSERRTSDAFEHTGKDLKSVPKAGTVGVLLTIMVILALIATAMLGITLLFRN